MITGIYYHGKRKRPTVRIWDGDLLVEYVDSDGTESSFILKDEQDIRDLKIELSK